MPSGRVLVEQPVPVVVDDLHRILVDQAVAVVVDDDLHRVRAAPDEVVPEHLAGVEAVADRKRPPGLAAVPNAPGAGSEGAGQGGESPGEGEPAGEVEAGESASVRHRCQAPSGQPANAVVVPGHLALVAAAQAADIGLERLVDAAQPQAVAHHVPHLLEGAQARRCEGIDVENLEPGLHLHRPDHVAGLGAGEPPVCRVGLRDVYVTHGQPQFPGHDLRLFPGAQAFGDVAALCPGPDQQAGSLDARRQAELLPLLPVRRLLLFLADRDVLQDLSAPQQGYQHALVEGALELPVPGGLVHAAGARLGDQERFRRGPPGVGSARISRPGLLLQARDELPAQGEELLPVGGTGEPGAHLLQGHLLLVEDLDHLPAVVGSQRLAGVGPHGKSVDSLHQVPHRIPRGEVLVEKPPAAGVGGQRPLARQLVEIPPLVEEPDDLARLLFRSADDVRRQDPPVPVALFIDPADLLLGDLEVSAELVVLHLLHELLDRQPAAAGAEFRVVVIAEPLGFQHHDLAVDQRLQQLPDPFLPTGRPVALRQAVAVLAKVGGGDPLFPDLDQRPLFRAAAPATGKERQPQESGRQETRPHSPPPSDSSTVPSGYCRPRSRSKRKRASIDSTGSPR